MVAKKEVKKILSLLKKHNNWRKNCINLIASENVMSPFCEKLYVSDLMHRYAEGLPFKRYYQGNKYFDLMEEEVTEIFKRHFGANFADIRPISGTSANLATFSSLAKRDDKILTLGIQGGSHVSHEEPGAAGILGLKVFHLGFDKKELNIDLDKTKEKILKIKPKFIILGGSVILFPQPVRELKKICQKVGAKIIYDAAHVFGLVASGYFQDPLKEGADIITSSTHKTFPGPQGGIILGKIKKDLQKKIQSKVFPGVLSNHHLHRIPPLFAALMEIKKYGKAYAGQIIKNAKTLAKELYNLGFDVLGEKKGFTASHQVLVNIERNGGGDSIAKTLERANIILNKNVPLGGEVNVKNPAGLRIGTQEMTRFGMREKEMKQIAKFIKEVVLDKKSPEGVKRKVVNFRKNFQKMKYCL